MILAVMLLAIADIPDSQLYSRVDGREVYPPPFRGGWAKTSAGCTGVSQERFEITENRIIGYEWDSLLLKSTPVIHEGRGNGRWAYTVVVLTAVLSD